MGPSQIHCGGLDFFPYLCYNVCVRLKVAENFQKVVRLNEKR